MSLRIFMWDPNGHGVPDLAGDCSFGLERYRSELWGSSAVRRVGAEVIPRLAVGGELFVGHADLQALEEEARRIGDASESIAADVFDESDPGRRAVIVRGRDGVNVYDAWGGKNPSESIVRYVENLIRAIDLARQVGCGICIW